MLKIAPNAPKGSVVFKENPFAKIGRQNAKRIPRSQENPAPVRHRHGRDSYTYINTAVDLRFVRGFNLLLQSERERRAPYTRYSQQLVFPTDDPETAAAEIALENILDEDPPLSGNSTDLE